MIRIILGVLVGFVVWSILWVGSDQLMIQTMGWYGEHQHAFQQALTNKEAFSPNFTILILNLIRSVVISLAAGYVAALIAKNSPRTTTIILGVLLLLFGIMVEAIAWHYLPVWYHFLFLFLLIPVTMAGGRLRRAS